MGGGFCVFNLAGDKIFTNWLEGQCRLIESQDKIEWTERPHLAGDFLVMGGQSRGDAQIHNVRTEYIGEIQPAFSLFRFDNERQELEIVAVILPNDLKFWLDSYDDTHIFVEAPGYDVSPNRFHVKAELPFWVTRTLLGDEKVEVVVREQDPQLSGHMPLSVECIEK